MPKEYVVQQGDCISSIAEKEGFFWETLWSENSELKQVRKDPNRLLAGDVVKIPDKREHKQSCANEQKHTFKKKGTPAKLRIVLEEDGVPIKNEAYVLKVDGETVEGQTDDTGMIDEWINPIAALAILDIAGMTYELELGGMDPVEDIVGVQARLQNLGFYDGELDGEVGPLTKDAIAEFRGQKELEPGEEIDDELRQALIAWADKEHEQASESTSDEEVPESDDGEDDDDLDRGDGTTGDDDDEDDIEVHPDE